MSISRSIVTGTVTLGVCSLATVAAADVFTTRFPVSELHATSTNAAGSLAGCAVMGAQGFSNAPPPSDWETLITSSCTLKTKSLSPPTTPSGPPLSVWPATCNPTGMALALNQFTPDAHWVTSTFLSTNQAGALSSIVSSLRSFGSPAVIPLYGQADHWIAIKEVTATLNTTTGVYAINQVKAFDGGRVGGTDSGSNGFATGMQTWGGSTFPFIYFRVITAINPSCDPCTSDPFYDKYVNMFEPPVNQSVPELSVKGEKSPGIVSGPQGMTPHVAQTRVWDSLQLAKIHEDAQTWSALAGGYAGPSFRVDAVFPDGSPWVYYLVPILSDANTAIAFVQLSATDGSFEGINVLSVPVKFSPPSKSMAQQLAAGRLGHGESLGAGKLTWDPRNTSSLIQSPNFPYYEFDVANGAGGKKSIRVALHNGLTARD